MSAIADRRGARLALGLVCVVLGAYLVADPFSSLGLLAGLLAAALLLSAVAELLELDARASRPRALAAAAAWLLAAALVALLPGLSLLAIALICGIGLLAGGLARLAGSLEEQGEQRTLLALGGVAALLAGVLALSWPAVTVLALAVIVGVRTILFGLAVVAGALGLLDPAGARQGERSRPAGAVRWAATLGVLALVLAGTLASVLLNAAASTQPGPFYEPPSPLPPGPHGTLIRQQLIPGFYQGAKAYRVLYKSTGFDGRPEAVSGIVVVPEGPPPRGGRMVVAFTHGTVGVARNCAPSLRDAAAVQVIEGLGQFLAAGDVVAATDYSGLGAPGIHPYLVGRVEAMDALDSVRAAHRLPGSHAGVRFAVWGHSQGGQAALFTGQLAASYAPDLRLAGVAASAPTTDLLELFKLNLNQTVGKVLIAMALSSWSKLYPGADLAKILTPAGRLAVADIARHCLYDKQYLASVPAAATLSASSFTSLPWTVEPWQRIIAENTLGASPIGAPLLLAQGGADPIVASRFTAQLAHELCARGETVDLRIYPGVEHLEAGIVASPDVAAWIAQRFAGHPAPSSCGAVPQPR